MSNVLSEKNKNEKKKVKVIIKTQIRKEITNENFKRFVDWKNSIRKCIREHGKESQKGKGKRRNLSLIFL